MRFAVAALVLALALPGLAAADHHEETAAAAKPADGTSAKQYTLRDLTGVQQLRCDALREGKVARQKAEIYRTQANHARAVEKLGYEQRLQQAEADAGIAFESAGRLKRQLTRMVDAFVSGKRVQWYKTFDQATKIKLEDQIVFANSLLEKGCSGD